MKSFTAIFVGVLVMIQPVFAGTLLLSGTVPDRGFKILDPNSSNPKFIPQEDSVVKVFIADIKANRRSPQSLADSEFATPFSSVNGWKKLTASQPVTTSSYIKVEAP